jgi:hypothetical protein
LPSPIRRIRLIELPSRILPPPSLEFVYVIQTIAVIVVSSINNDKYALHAANDAQAALDFVLFVAVDGVEAPGPSAEPYCGLRQVSSCIIGQVSRGWEMFVERERRGHIYAPYTMARARPRVMKISRSASAIEVM